MEVRHADKSLARLEADEHYTAGFGTEVVKAFRRRMQYLRAAVDERDFYNMKSLHYEKLKGKRSGERSMRLNDQFRLILEIAIEETKRTAIIIGIEDYH
jgi:proteic killer suppression protein